MAYSKNYYAILNLPRPSSIASSTQSTTLPTAQIKTQYKAALLAAHPDKSAAGKSGNTQAKSIYSVDDVKEAFAVLSDTRKKRDYDRWFRTHGATLNSPSPSHQQQGQADRDFILGLEVLDLSDFTEHEVVIPNSELDESQMRNLIDVADSHPAHNFPPAKEVLMMEWRRACRCGHETGFRIMEGELEDASERGAKEVLVGCEGCSLWLRVGFDVEEFGAWGDDFDEEDGGDGYEIDEDRIFDREELGFTPEPEEIRVVMAMADRAMERQYGGRYKNGLRQMDDDELDGGRA